MGSYPTASFLPSVKKQWIAIYGQLPQEKEVEELYQQFEHYLFKDLVKHSTLKPDTLETIERLRNAGINIGSTNGFNAPMMTIVAETAKKKGIHQTSWQLLKTSKGMVDRFLI